MRSERDLVLEKQASEAFHEQQTLVWFITQERVDMRRGRCLRRSDPQRGTAHLAGGWEGGRAVTCAGLAKDAANRRRGTEKPLERDGALPGDTSSRRRI